MEFLKTLLIACIPAIITGFVSYFVARKNASAQIKVVEKQNKHDLEAHKLEMEKLEQEHKNKIELQKIEYESKLLQQEKEGQNAMATEAVKGIFGMFGSAMNAAMDAAMNTPEGQQMLNDSIKNSQKNKEEE